MRKIVLRFEKLGLEFGVWIESSGFKGFVVSSEEFRV